MITHKSGVAARSIGPVFKLTSVAIGKKTTALIFNLSHNGLIKEREKSTEIVIFKIPYT